MKFGTCGAKSLVRKEGHKTDLCTWQVFPAGYLPISEGTQVRAKKIVSKKYLVVLAPLLKWVDKSNISVSTREMNPNEQTNL